VNETQTESALPGRGHMPRGTLLADIIVKPRHTYDTPSGHPVIRVGENHYRDC